MTRVSSTEREAISLVLNSGRKTRRKCLTTHEATLLCRSSTRHLTRSSSRKILRFWDLLRDALCGLPSFISRANTDFISSALRRRSSIGAKECPISPQVPSSEYQERNTRFPGSKLHEVPGPTSQLRLLLDGKQGDGKVLSESCAHDLDLLTYKGAVLPATELARHGALDA